MAGIAFGFLGTNLAVILVMIVVLTVIVAVGGMYTGFRLGMTWRSMVYVMGAVLLFAAAVDVLVRKVL